MNRDFLDKRTANLIQEITLLILNGWVNKIFKVQITTLPEHDFIERI